MPTATPSAAVAMPCLSNRVLVSRLILLHARICPCGRVASRVTQTRFRPAASALVVLQHACGTQLALQFGDPGIGVHARGHDWCSRVRRRRMPRQPQYPGSRSRSASARVVAPPISSQCSTVVRLTPAAQPHLRLRLRRAGREWRCTILESGRRLCAARWLQRRVRPRRQAPRHGPAERRPVRPRFGARTQGDAPSDSRTSRPLKRTRSKRRRVGRGV